MLNRFLHKGFDLFSSKSDALACKALNSSDSLVFVLTLYLELFFATLLVVLER